VIDQKALIDSAIVTAMRVKTDHVRRVHGKPGKTDILTCVTAFHGDRPAVMAVHPPHRDTMLFLAHIMSGGMAADAVSAVMDSYIADDKHAGLNPRTKEPWEPGELSELVAKHRGIERGWVREALTLTVVSREAGITLASLPYTLKGRIVHWDDPIHSDTGASEGIVPDAMRDAMKAPTVLATMAADGVMPLATDDPAEYERRMTTLDCSAIKMGVKVLPEAVPDRPAFVKYVVLAEPGSPRWEAAHRSFADEPELGVDIVPPPR
jgi:hypothetical protein